MTALPDAVPPPAPIALTLPDEAATVLLGGDLASALAPGDAVALHGDLWAGKTTLARAILRALADDPALDVPSPTFTLVQPYPDGRLPALHLDLYRLADPFEADELGVEDALLDGVALIEWPERGDIPSTITIHLAEDGPGRTARITGTVEAMERVKRSLAVRAMLAEAGAANAPRRPLSADAGTRRYEAVERGDETLLVMNAPATPDGPPVRDGLPYSRIAHLAEDVAPFVAVANALRARGFAAPAIHRADLDRGLLLVDHLGSGSILDDGGRPIPERYGAVAETLAALHDADWPALMPLPGGLAHRVPTFDRSAMLIEVELTLDWAFPRLVGRPAREDERVDFLAAWNGALDALNGAETSLVLRDVQAPNIVWREGAEGIARVGLIDFQDALIGPAAYDLASLAQDARVTIPPGFEVELIETYRAARARPADPMLDAAYAVMAAQRATKVFGLWVRLDERDGKPDYLVHTPRTREYLGRVLPHPALAPVRAWFDAHDLLARSARMHP